MFEHKGYLGRTEIDEEAGIIHGEVEGLRAVITFQGETVKEARQAFRQSVDDYLAWCAERGKDPEKPYSGKIMVRSSPQLHRELARRAASEGKSLNQKAVEALDQAVTKPAGRAAGGPAGGPAGRAGGKATRSAEAGQKAGRSTAGEPRRKATRAAKKKGGPK